MKKEERTAWFKDALEVVKKYPPTLYPYRPAKPNHWGSVDGEAYGDRTFFLAIERDTLMIPRFGKETYEYQYASGDVFTRDGAHILTRKDERTVVKGFGRTTCFLGFMITVCWRWSQRCDNGNGRWVLSFGSIKPTAYMPSVKYTRTLTRTKEGRALPNKGYGDVKEWGYIDWCDFRLEAFHSCPLLGEMPKRKVRKYVSRRKKSNVKVEPVKANLFERDLELQRQAAARKEQRQAAAAQRKEQRAKRLQDERLMRRLRIEFAAGKTSEQLYAAALKEDYLRSVGL